METNHSTNNALKQALQQRKQGDLPSNFSFRMMEQIRREAVKQQKRKDRVMLYSIITASLSLIALAVYVLFFQLEISWKEIFPDIQWQSSSALVFSFYIYIGILVLALLGFDYWMRRRKSIS